MTEKISVDLAQSVEESELGVITAKGRKETEENTEDQLGGFRVLPAADRTLVMFEKDFINIKQ